MYAIEVMGITKYYGELKALDEVSFKVREGVVFGLLGPNGAGKTTLLRILTTLLKPSAGTARVAGYDILKQPMEVRRRIGYLPEDTGIYPRMTPVEFLLYYARLYGMSYEDAVERIDHYLDMFNLVDKRDVIADKLSKGMRRKLAIIRALLFDPPVLIMDEPTTGLDVVSAREVRELIREKAARGKTVILSTHNMYEAEELCRELALIHKGRIVEVGEMREVLEKRGEKRLEDVFMQLGGGR
ncbi:MAG: hypothetical protein DRN96_03720 [Thermoproteota archaeon]|mgnify:CR=1 FL=1|nr:MAG: hypothetical protein DRN96_03720 [Candidatus Korarchaeota archaeon]